VAREGISAVRHAPLIEAAPLFFTANVFTAFTVKTIIDEEGNEQLSRKRDHFKIQNEYF
jgi:hypothetical protein